VSVLTVLGRAKVSRFGWDIVAPIVRYISGYACSGEVVLGADSGL
jgi:hypothetical protein